MKRKKDVYTKEDVRKDTVDVCKKIMEITDGINDSSAKRLATKKKKIVSQRFKNGASCFYINQVITEEFNDVGFKVGEFKHIANKEHRKFCLKIENVRTTAQDIFNKHLAHTIGTGLKVITIKTNKGKFVLSTTKKELNIY